MEKLRETGGAVAGEGTPGFAGGPEAGTAPEGATRSGAENPKGGARRFSAAERACQRTATLAQSGDIQPLRS